MAPTVRSRLVYAALLLLTILLGIASRHFAPQLPRRLAKDPGDVLYATMAFWLVGLLLPRLPTGGTAVAALAFCVLVEFAKLIQTPWLVAVRHRAWGHLVLGTGFHVSNLVCYAAGVLLAAGLEAGWRRRQRDANRAGTKASV